MCWDAADPDGIRFGPAAADFRDLVTAVALGLTDALFCRSGPRRTELEALLGSELDPRLAVVARGVLDRLAAHVAEHQLDAAEDVFDLDLECESDEEEDYSVLLVLPREVPGGAELAAAHSSGSPDLADVPFVFHDGSGVEEALASLLDDDGDPGRSEAGDTLAQHLFDYLCGVGGCDPECSWVPRADKVAVRTALEAGGLKVRELVNGSTRELYTLGLGTRAVLDRIAALRGILGP
jgi:hypothetical protein